LVQLLPVVFLASPGARFQPVYVADVAQAFVTSLTELASLGKSYDLCGPKVYTLRELVEYVARTTGHCRPVIGLNDSLSYLQALSMEFLPVKLMTRDNYYSMKVDSVCACEFPFGLHPAALEAVAPVWLARRTPRARYMRLRDRAGR
ncbi:MAG: complex I NDUFA9 subunit family protein, partial [Betaproteobacteria bacterium]|nr:complex I NDUFA9 subunit family protein [Betaproteobacteria bacterium]